MSASACRGVCICGARRRRCLRSAPEAGVGGGPARFAMLEKGATGHDQLSQPPSLGLTLSAAGPESPYLQATEAMVFGVRRSSMPT